MKSKIYVYENGRGLRIFFILECFLPGGYAKAVFGSSSSYLKSGIARTYQYLFMRCREPTEGEISLYRAQIYISKYKSAVRQWLKN